MPEPTWLSYQDAADFEDLPVQIDPQSAAWRIAVEAAAGWVEDHNKNRIFGGPSSVPARLRLGTSRLAHRWYDRKGTPLGAAQFSEFAGEMLRSDPDIAMLLGIGRHRPFQFGVA